MDISSIKRAASSAVEGSKGYLDIGSIHASLRQSQHHCQTSLSSLLSQINSSLNINITPFHLLFLLTLFSITIPLTILLRHRRFPSKAPGTPLLEKASFPLASKPPSTANSTPARKPGEWTPSDFRPPTPPPYPDWSIETTSPLPYRPFRYGPKYFVTMGLRTVNFDDWIELDNHYPRYHTDKARRITERGDKCCRTAPEAVPAAEELLDELTTYLPARYPTLYSRTATGLLNLWSNESLPTLVRPCPEDPMQLAARLVQDDLAIMLERPDGQYYLLAGAILLPGFWRLSDKFGMPLSEIHTSGDVPQFREKLEKGMMNFFRRLKPSEIVARNNYFLQVDDDLGWSWSIGDEDSEHVSWNTAEKNRAVDHHYFRSERQTLRRLPRSGGVVFTIRTYFEKVVDVCEEEYVPGRLASAVRSWGDDVSRYKGRERYGEVLLEYLDQKHEEQVRAGLKVEEEDEKRSYPW